MFNFDKKTELVIQSIAGFGAKTGVQVFFVGGMVRDCLMEIEIKDIDILIEGSAIDFVQGFALEYGKNCCDGTSCNNKEGLDVEIKSIHESFNTAKTVINGIEIDFASTRKEEYPKSGCLPVVTKTGCPIADDLIRRDFTVNAIAARVLLTENGKLKYEIIDPYFGADDIKKKSLKILHDKSYIDDPTRILRGLDFSLRFGFDFSKKDKVLIKEYLKSPDREGLSIDRVKLTLKKLFSEQERAKEAYLKILENAYFKIWQDAPSFEKEWAQRLYDAVKIFSTEPSKVFMAAVFENFRTENSSDSSHMDSKLSENASNYEIYNFYKTLSNEDLALRYAILDDNLVLHYFKNLKDIKPDFTGEDLIKEGFAPGKSLGEELKNRFKNKLNALSQRA